MVQFIEEYQKFHKDVDELENVINKQKESGIVNSNDYFAYAFAKSVDKIISDYIKNKKKV